MATSLNILVVGGAGYIGSHMVKNLGKKNINVTILDDLSSGYRDAVSMGEFIQGDCGDPRLLDQILSKGYDAVMHFASSIQVGESILTPDKYYRNNFVNTMVLLDAMRRKNINHFIFSSSAATYGEPKYCPIDERHPQSPINPYGRTKLMVEQLLLDYEKAFGMKSVCLRYFNAAGADPECELGERHDPETHIIPLVLQVASGRRQSFSLFGIDYKTPDGTCIRDYIHVEDICSAHWLGLNSLIDGANSQVYNLGNEKGYSIRQVINAAEHTTGRKIPIINFPAREGDPAVLIADSSLIRMKLGWQPKFQDLETIIDHAWKWEIKLKNLKNS